jgi:hypothetical protein
LTQGGKGGVWSKVGSVKSDLESFRFRFGISKSISKWSETAVSERAFGISETRNETEISNQSLLLAARWSVVGHSSKSASWI